MESFVNLTNAKVSAGSEIERMYKEKFPTACKEYEDIINKMANGAEPIVDRGKIIGWEEKRGLYIEGLKS